MWIMPARREPKTQIRFIYYSCTLNWNCSRILSQWENSVTVCWLPSGHQANLVTLPPQQYKWGEYLVLISLYIYTITVTSKADLVWKMNLINCQSSKSKILLKVLILSNYLNTIMLVFSKMMVLEI